MSVATTAAAERPSLILPPGSVRLLLAALVVVSHITRLDIGRLAVVVFFYLSGYWTARIWEEKFSGRDVLKFYAARYLRIAPLYMLAMFGASVLRHMPLHLENLTLIGVASTLRDPTQVSWSLDIELQFYLLLPFLVGAARRWPAWVSMLAAIVLSAAGVWIQTQFGVVTVARYLPAFVAGALTHAKAWKPGEAQAQVSLVAFAAATLATTFTPFISKDVADPFDRDIYALLWAAPILPYVAASLARRSTPVDRHLGNLSYPIYLFHFPILALAIPHVGDSFPHKLAIAIAACGFAAVVYWVFDRPVDRWRVKLTETGGRRTADREATRP